MKAEQRNKLYGLVLMGGQSRRMKKDKALIDYHGSEQYKHCYGLLSKYCEKVFLSLRPDQENKYDSKAYSVILDNENYCGQGPLAGIITAMEMHPDRSFLVLACDLPNVNEQVIEELLKKRTKEFASAFRSSYDRLPEPLCAIYENEILPVLKESFQKGLLCPRKILINAGISLIDADNSDALENINRPDELNRYQAK